MAYMRTNALPLPSLVERRAVIQHFDLNAFTVSPCSMECVIGIKTVVNHGRPITMAECKDCFKSGEVNSFLKNRFLTAHADGSLYPSNTGRCYSQDTFLILKYEIQELLPCLQCPMDFMCRQDLHDHKMKDHFNPIRYVIIFYIVLAFNSSLAT